MNFTNFLAASTFTASCCWSIANHLLLLHQGLVCLSLMEWYFNHFYFTVSNNLAWYYFQLVPKEQCGSLTSMKFFDVCSTVVLRTVHQLCHCWSVFTCFFKTFWQISGSSVVYLVTFSSVNRSTVEVSDEGIEFLGLPPWPLLPLKRGSQVYNLYL